MTATKKRGLGVITEQMYNNVRFYALEKVSLASTALHILHHIFHKMEVNNSMCLRITVRSSILYLKDCLGWCVESEVLSYKIYNGQNSKFKWHFCQTFDMQNLIMLKWLKKNKLCDIRWHTQYDHL